MEPDHYICAGIYCCTEQGFGEINRARSHVFYISAFEYDQSIKSDRRAPAWESMIIGHIECTAEGLGIRCYGHALLNHPRLIKYKGSHKLFKCMAVDDEQYTYTNWEVSAPADAIEGFVGIRVGSPMAPPDLSTVCEDTIGVVGYTEVRFLSTRTLSSPPK